LVTKTRRDSKMKIAIESNDGVTIKSPFLPTNGYIVYDVDKSEIISREYRENSRKNKKRANGDIVFVSNNIHSLLNDCSTIISRGMDRSNLDIFKKEGKDVFITFKTSSKDAVRIYLREQLISHRMAH
jgi:predicted Fe-Mo cluster-binding NifX family protein